MENFSSFRYGLPYETEHFPCFFNLGLDLYYRIFVICESLDFCDNFVKKGAIIKLKKEVHIINFLRREKKQ